MIKVILILIILFLILCLLREFINKYSTFGATPYDVTSTDRPIKSLGKFTIGDQTFDIPDKLLNNLSTVTTVFTTDPASTTDKYVTPSQLEGVKTFFDTYYKSNPNVLLFLSDTSPITPTFSTAQTVIPGNLSVVAPNIVTSPTQTSISFDSLKGINIPKNPNNPSVAQLQRTLLLIGILNTMGKIYNSNPSKSGDLIYDVNEIWKLVGDPTTTTDTITYNGQSYGFDYNTYVLVWMIVNNRMRVINNRITNYQNL